MAECRPDRRRKPGPNRELERRPGIGLDTVTGGGAGKDEVTSHGQLESRDCHGEQVKIRMEHATLSASKRSQIPSFIVMDVLRDAAEKDRKLIESGSDQRVLHLEVV